MTSSKACGFRSAPLQLEMLEDRTVPAILNAAMLSITDLPVAASDYAISADFNGDGATDSIEVQEDFTISVHPSQEGPSPPVMSQSVEGSFKPVIVGDFNRNGIMDLAVASKALQGITVLLGRGDGTFHQPLLFTTGNSGPDVLLVGDFNGDGHLDLAGLVLAEDHIAVLHGNGDGNFGNAVLLSFRKTRIAQPATTPSPATQILTAADHEREPFSGMEGTAFEQVSPTEMHPFAPAFEALASLGQLTEETSDVLALLSNFGNAVPFVRMQEPDARLTEFFVLQGLGLADAVDIPLDWGPTTVEFPPCDWTAHSPDVIGSLDQGPGMGNKAGGRTSQRVDESALSGFNMMMDNQLPTVPEYVNDPLHYLLGGDLSAPSEGIAVPGDGEYSVWPERVSEEARQSVDAGAIVLLGIGLQCAGTESSEQKRRVTVQQIP